VTDIFNVTIRIDGTFMTSNNISAWPIDSPSGTTLASFSTANSKNITYEGTGVLNGQGYVWWWYTILTTEDNRPRLFYITKSENIYIHQLTFKDSPNWTIDLEDNNDVVVRNISVITNVTDQKYILSNTGHLSEEGIPTFPLNTDGIDARGTNYLIENVFLENFDDAVAIKPGKQGGKYGNCSENMIIRNSVVVFSVGMAIGSVPPNNNVNCVRNITFENITMHSPIKAIYVKTNPGESGSGIIDNVTYRNFWVNNSLWYPIWIGPQQQRQPGTEGTGCSFLYPLVDKCPTQPRVTLTNIVLQNITLLGGLTLPGVILCNETNPCRDFVWEDVYNEGPFFVGEDYVCQYASGIVSNSKPAPSCFTPVEEDQVEDEDMDHQNEVININIK